MPPPALIAPFSSLFPTPPPPREGQPLVRRLAVQIGQDDGEHPAAGGADSAEEEGDRGPPGAAGEAELPAHPAAAPLRGVREGSGAAGGGTKRHKMCVG